MSNFEVLVLKVNKVINHPNADRLSVVTVRDYPCVSAKLDDGTPRYNVGDLVVYVPEGAIVPEYLLRQGFWDDKNNKGFLAGPEGNRVKTIKLRGHVSIGIMFPVENGKILNKNGAALEVHENMDVATFLGITKYEPPIPTIMGGEVISIFGHTPKYDIENMRKYPDIFKVGEMVNVTEKTHGTFCMIGRDPTLGYNSELMNGHIFAGSKGLSSQGLVFKYNDTNKGNIYNNVLDEVDSEGRNFGTRFTNYCEYLVGNVPCYLFGEIYGSGVQDLTYGLKTKKFAAFDFYVGVPGMGYFLNVNEKVKVFKELHIDMVPSLYTGPFNMDIINDLTSGLTVIGNGANIREGVVITPCTERKEDELGRVILKSVSEAYLLRKGNTTEYN